MAILRGHQSHAKLFAGQRQYLHFSVMLRPWVLVWSARNQTCDLPLCSQVLLLTELILLWCSNTIIHFISEGSAMWIWWNGSKRWVTVYGAIFMITERLSLWNKSILVSFTRYWTTFHSCVQVIALCTNDVTISSPWTNIEPTWSV